ncbi:MAG: sialidase family protein [Pirellulaceae bacterium]
MYDRRKRSYRIATAIFCVGLVGNVCSDEGSAAEAQPELRHTDYQEAFFGDDHASEGVLAPLDDGRIMLGFRLDPGIQGNHVGTNAYIASMTYDPVKDEWGTVQTVYNSRKFDDRNIHGGVTNDGRIVIFFRHYDGRRTQGRYFLNSDDNGRTWSEPKVSEAWSDPATCPLKGIWSTGQMFYNPDVEKYMMMGCRRYLTWSRDGTRWEEYIQITENDDYKLSEIAGAWCGDDRLIALIRDDRRQHGHPLVQLESRDNGETWSEPVPTNMPPDRHWGCAPQLIYDKSRDLLVALTSDRYSRPNKENSLFVYTARPNEVMGKPENWTLRYELTRPWAQADFYKDRPLNQNLYGYPTIAPINQDEYLVVFTERAVMHGAEQADLYYFRLIFE